MNDIITTDENEAKKQKVRDFLKKSKWTIEELAKSLERSESQIKRYITTKEKHSNVPPDEVIEKLEDVKKRLEERMLLND